MANVVHQTNAYMGDIFFPKADTTFMERLEASTVIGGGSVLAAAGIVEVGGAALGGGGPLTNWVLGNTTATATATATGGSAATAACADGDCTNEVRAVGQTARSVWELNPFQRGVKIENMLGRSPELSQNFPVIDRFENGVATSIKSIDLSAASYQNISTLSGVVRRYVNTLANWQGAQWGGVEIKSSSILARELLLAIPPGASEAQLAALQELQQWSTSVGVTLNIVVVP